LIRRSPIRPGITNPTARALSAYRPAPSRQRHPSRQSLKTSCWSRSLTVTLRSTTTSRERRRMVSANDVPKLAHKPSADLSSHTPCTFALGKGHIPLRYPVADQVADLRARVVCVSQAGRKLVESQLRTGLRPGSSYISTCPDSSNPSATGRKSGLRPDLQCDLDSVMEFGHNPVTLTCDLSVPKQHTTRHCLGSILYRVRSE